MSFFKNIFSTSEEENTSSKVTWIQFTNINQLNEIITQSVIQPVVIFKHSTRCSVSRMALRYFENEFNSSDKVILYFLDLLEHRAISNEIAARFEVIHQSPQLLLISNGKCIYNASHSSIEADSLKRYL